MDFSGFDWDEGNLAKCAKHGVSRTLTEALFQSGLMVLTDAAQFAAGKLIQRHRANR